ncbi:TetR/AcrR family transcriptional regulator [Hoyosella altamirensis]|uniref:AcrR family transcriptional regulator n=1 Tax=Hoyosella altamirensis TaxID=616997 RepID=A0A839RSI4_9ACTN|nr:TetR/AcrR family transcriptional regulator [Hoyosella altamirensis]MBB3039086.1 AcrR family transcriptional regulator [Hoyosella altamirensis]
MATTYSLGSRASQRRQATIDEIVKHAVEIMTVDGVGALSISEIARRMHVRPPSLYKYFPSLHSVYDELFARGARDLLATAQPALDTSSSAVEGLRALAVVIVRWCVENPAVAHLMYMRPVPGFEPSPEAFAPNVEAMRLLRNEIARYVRFGHLKSGTDVDEVTTLFTVVISGLISQQLANEPAVSFGIGRFSSLTERAVDVFLSSYLPTPTETQ